MEVLTRRKANYNERDDGLNLLQQNSQYLESLIMRPQNRKMFSHGRSKGSKKIIVLKTLWS